MMSRCSREVFFVTWRQYTRTDYEVNLDLVKELNTHVAMELIGNYSSSCSNNILRMPSPPYFHALHCQAKDEDVYEDHTDTETRHWRAIRPKMCKAAFATDAYEVLVLSITLCERLQFQV
jgi:hypothetical protein